MELCITPTLSRMAYAATVSFIMMSWYKVADTDRRRAAVWHRMVHDEVDAMLYLILADAGSKRVGVKEEAPSWCLHPVLYWGIVPCCHCTGEPSCVASGFSSCVLNAM